jgi:hypothetical protein
MTAHFLLTAAARTLTLASVARMSDEEAERVFVRLRWSDNNGDAYCPHCGLCLSPPERRVPLALQSLSEGFQRYLRDAVRLPQDAATGLPDGRDDLL